MPVELKQHFVAFLDILGFSDMVNEDVSSEDQKNLSKLFRCHQSAAKIFSGHPDCLITQFSDSIVVSKPYEAAAFEWFVTKVAEYQRLLLDEELLCRGGVAVNKHYTNGTFTFSAGLIAAYKVESTLARYPRVVISPELLELVSPGKSIPSRKLIKEDDGLLFIDYIGAFKRRRQKRLENSIETLVIKLIQASDPSIREKGIWLASYADSILSTALRPRQFDGHSVHQRTVAY